MGSALTQGGIPVEAFVAGYPDEIRSRAEILRGVVKRVVPEVVERVRPGWHLVRLRPPDRTAKGLFAFVIPEAMHVHLGFEH